MILFSAWQTTAPDYGWREKEIADYFYNRMRKNWPSGGNRRATETESGTTKLLFWSEGLHYVKGNVAKGLAFELSNTRGVNWQLKSTVIESAICYRTIILSLGLQLHCTEEMIRICIQMTLCMWDEDIGNQMFDLGTKYGQLLIDSLHLKIWKWLSEESFPFSPAVRNISD